jgi:hypothetical protein
MIVGMRILSLVITGSIFFHAAFADAVDDSWTQISDREGIKTYRKSVPGTSFYAFAGDGVIDAHISKVVGVAMDSQRGPEYVDLLVDVAPIWSRGGEFRVWQHYDLPWPVSDRDYALEGSVTADADKKTVTISYKSVVDSQMPTQDCCIRADITRSFFRYTALPGNKTRIECEIITDPKGILPAWMANMAQKDWAYKTIRGYRTQTLKPYVVADKAYAGW